jgi:hypothetical protein
MRPHLQNNQSKTNWMCALSVNVKPGVQIRIAPKNPKQQQRNPEVLTKKFFVGFSVSKYM